MDHFESELESLNSGPKKRKPDKEVRWLFILNIVSTFILHNFSMNLNQHKESPRKFGSLLRSKVLTCQERGSRRGRGRLMKQKQQSFYGHFLRLRRGWRAASHSSFLHFSCSCASSSNSLMFLSTTWLHIVLSLKNCETDSYVIFAALVQDQKIIAERASLKC